MTDQSDRSRTFDDVSTDVGSTTGLIEFEAEDGYGRIAVKRTPEGESDELVLQAAGSDGYHTIETIARVGRFSSRALDWDDLYDNLELTEA